jgi:hypothetical protein
MAVYFYSGVIKEQNGAAVGHTETGYFSGTAEGDSRDDGGVFKQIVTAVEAEYGAVGQIHMQQFNKV